MVGSSEKSFMCLYEWWFTLHVMFFRIKNLARFNSFKPLVATMHSHLFVFIRDVHEYGLFVNLNWSKLIWIVWVESFIYLGQNWIIQIKLFMHVLGHRFRLIDSIKIKSNWLKLIKIYRVVYSEAKIPATVLLARHRTVGGRKFRIWVAAKGGMQTLVLQIENCERMVL